VRGQGGARFPQISRVELSHLLFLACDNLAGAVNVRLS
jgi:hypothetical protein